MFLYTCDYSPLIILLRRENSYIAHDDEQQLRSHITDLN